MTVEPDVGLQLCRWDGQPTRHVPLCRLDADEHGTWYRWPAGAPATGSDGVGHSHPGDLLVLVPDHGTWMARFGDDGVLDLHVKVTTATAVTEHGISAVDLDLDVVRFSGDGAQRSSTIDPGDGAQRSSTAVLPLPARVAVVDQDSFDRARIDLAYPADLVERALRTTRALYRALSRGDEPFGVVGADRLRALHRAMALAR